MKRLIALFLTFVMIVTSVYISKPDAKEVQASEASSGGAAIEAEGQKLDMLTIKMQALEQTYDNGDGKERTDLRIVSSIDSLDYKRVGFKIWYDVDATKELPDKPTINWNGWEAATRLEAGMEYKYSPKVIDTSSEYLFTATLKGILKDNFGKYFYIKAYYITLDGQTVEGAGRFFNLNAAYDKTLINIPVEMTQAQYNNMNDVTVAGATYTVSANQVQKVFYDGKYAHLHIKVTDKTALQSASLVQVGTGEDAPKAIYRNLLSDYTVDDSGYTNGDTSWYDVYDQVYPDKNQFIIANEADLYGMAEMTQSYLNKDNLYEGVKFYLVKDMTMNTVDSNGVFQTKTQWKGISVYVKSATFCNFAGIFDGQGHTISGIYRTSTNSYGNIGFFSRVAATAQIRNFTLKNSNFEGTQYVGGLVGYAKGGTFENISVDAQVTGTTQSVGGFIGQSDTNVSFSNCQFVNGNVSGPTKVGGFIGYLCTTTSRSILDNCNVSGTVNASSQIAGGFVGTAETPLTLDNCFSVVTATGTKVGSIIGYLNTSKLYVHNVYNAKNEQNNSGVSSYNIQVGTIKKLTETEAKDKDAFVNTMLNFKDYWTVVDGKYPELRMFASKVQDEPQDTNRVIPEGGDMTWKSIYAGTEADPYVLKDAADLLGLAIFSQTEEFISDTINEFTDKYFVLENDITVNYINNVDSQDGRFVSWVPIGGTGDYTFKGNFNGNHHTISGLYYNDTTQSTKGLFARISNSPTIENISLSDCVITAKKQVGALAGVIESGTYKNIHIDDSVEVTATSTATDVEVGGLAGRLVPYAAINIEQCWVQATVVATLEGNLHAMVGGIVGRASKDTTPQHITINNCMVEGSITTQAKSAGGICGYVGINTPVNVQNCVSMANVVAKEFAGGLLGALQEDTSKTYGSLTRVIVDNSYITTSKVVGYGNLKSDNTQTGLTTEQLTGDNAYSYTMLDFDSVWTVVTGKLLMLRVFAETPKPAPTQANKIYKADTSWLELYEGTEEDPYILKDAPDLMGFAQYTNGKTTSEYSFSGKYFVLANDIVVNVDNTAKVKNEWVSIGGNKIDSAFKGNFDGQGHTISGLYQNGSALCGLFSRAGVGAEIKNLVLQNCDMSAEQQLGALVGVADGGHYSNIRIMESVKVSATTNIGGMIGYLAPLADMVFDNCHFEGRVEASGSYAGGVTSKVQLSSRDSSTVRNIQFKNCSVTGDIEVEGNYSGGYCGYITVHSVTFLNCKFDKTGTLTSNNEQSGGFIGTMQGSAVCMEQCQLDGTVKSKGRIAGGFIGTMSGAKTGSVSMKYCLNTGTVDVSAYQTTFENGEGKQECNPYVGGFIGLVDTDKAQQTVDIKNCVSAVDIQLPDIEAEITTYGPIIGHSKSMETTVIERTYVTNDGKGSHIIGQYEQLSADKMKGASAQDNMPLLDWSVWKVTESYPTLPFDATSITPDEDYTVTSFATLSDAYKDCTLYQGELHAHALTLGQNDDGHVTLGEWKNQMNTLSLDFAASLDHKQTGHIEYYEDKNNPNNMNYWDKSMFIYGTEASTNLTKSSIQGTGHDNDQGEMHYNMLFKTKAELDAIVTKYSCWNVLSYKFSFTRTEMTNMIRDVMETGFFVHAHPRAKAFSTLTDDYFFTHYTGFEVIWNESSTDETTNNQNTRANYETWNALLKAGKRLYACAGSDTHYDLNTRALTSVYSTEAAQNDKGEIIDQLRLGNFVAGSVAIQMCIGEKHMGQWIDFDASQSLEINVAKLHSSANIAGHKYLVSVLSDQGVLYSRSLTVGEDGVPTNGKMSIPVDTNCKYYRVEIYDMTSGNIIALANPIWNGDVTQ